MATELHSVFSFRPTIDTHKANQVALLRSRPPKVIRMSSSVNLVRSLVRVPARRLRSSGARWFSSGGFSAVNADEGKLGTKFYHAINLAILAGVPIAIASSPSSLTMPLDVALGLALPLHGHIGMNYVITDYVPKSSRGPARAAMLAASVLAAVGLLKLNLTGAGLTETLKATWSGPRKKGAEDTDAKSMN